MWEGVIDAPTRGCVPTHTAAPTTDTKVIKLPFRAHNAGPHTACLCVEVWGVPGGNRVPVLLGSHTRDVALPRGQGITRLVVNDAPLCTLVDGGRDMHIQGSITFAITGAVLKHNEPL